MLVSYCVCVHIHMYTHMYIHTYIHACIHTYIHTYVHKYIYLYVHTYIHTYICMCMHACVHVYGKHEGSNQQFSLHTQYLCREILCYIFSSYLTIMFLYNALLGSKRIQRNFVWDHVIVFSASTLLCTTVFSCGIFWKYQGGQGVDKLVGQFYIAKHYDFVLDHSFI